MPSVFYFYFLFSALICCKCYVDTTGTKRSFAEELWVDKYKPNSLEELAVHKKKVKNLIPKVLILVVI